MNKETLLSDLQQTFRSHFKNDELLITAESTQDDIPLWDSLNHAALIDKIEKQYEIKFDLMDMISIRSIGDICDKIIAKKRS